MSLIEQLKLLLSLVKEPEMQNVIKEGIRALSEVVNNNRTEFIETTATVVSELAHSIRSKTKILTGSEQFAEQVAIAFIGKNLQ